MDRRLVSVWSWPDGLYHYYAVPSVLGDGEPAAPTTPRVSIRPPLGDPPAQLLRPLPPGALYVGRGRLAQGEIVMHGAQSWDA